MLTISGYGGTGKTRFSIELFRRLMHEYSGGAAFVSLASVTDAAEVLPTVSTSLDIAEAHGRSALEALCTVIGDQPMLLVLDNLEQVLDAAEEIAKLVARCPRLQVIATSRAPLKIGAESEFALPPLDLPAETETSPEALEACPSVAADNRFKLQNSGQRPIKRNSVNLSLAPSRRPARPQTHSAPQWRRRSTLLAAHREHQPFANSLRGTPDRNLPSRLHRSCDRPQ